MTWDPWKHPFLGHLLIDGEERPVKIARLSVAQKANFHIGLSRLMGTRGAPPAEDASLEAREAWDAERRRENVLRGAWLNDTIAEGLQIIAPWLSPDGIPVETAGDLVQAYQDDVVLTSCVLTIWTHNTLTAAQRKNLPSPSALLRSLVAGTGSAATGEPPAPIAASVEPAGSAASAIATGSPSETLAAS